MIYALIQRWKSSFICHPMQRFGYRYASELLRKAFKKGCFDPRQIRSICDFGSGLGGPSLAIQSFFSPSLKNLVLLEENALQARFAHKILPHPDIQIGDGLAWLRNTEQRFDLMTAFMLGPDYEDEGLVEDFLMVASQRLTDQGAILIASDVATMGVVQNRIHSLDSQHGHFECQWFLPAAQAPQTSFSLFQKPPLPYTLILSAKLGLSSQSISVETNPDPCLPEPVFHIVGEDVYCLTTAFEREYFKATVQTYKAFASPLLTGSRWKKLSVKRTP